MILDNPGHPSRNEGTFAKTALFQKNPRVRKIFVRNSGAGNGCANFMDTWKKCVRSAGKAMSIKFLVLGGGGIWVLGFGGGGGECRFYFMGARIFLTFTNPPFYIPSTFYTGPNFIHPHPPTPENTLLGVGGV